MSTSQLLDSSALELAQLIQGKSVSPREVVEVHINRMEAVNPALNALCHERFDLARQEAKAAEDRVMAGDIEGAPFLGVPISIKETLALKGLPHCAGLVSRKDLIATEDATVVARMRRAGAIPLGTTNVPELALWVESRNLLYGRTNNPWDLKRTPGGSSGGEAAVIAAGASPMGIGSDAAGSIRMPAHLCGVCGHKPTGGLVPGTGHMPPAPGEASLVGVVGPMARRVGDLRGMLKVMAGGDGLDSAVTGGGISLRAAPRPKDIKIFMLELNGLSLIPSIQKAMIDAEDALKHEGFKVETLSAPGIKDGVNLALARLTQAQGPLFRKLLGIEDMGFFEIWWRTLSGSLPITWPTALAASMEVLNSITMDPMATLAQEAQRHQEALEASLGELGVLITPAFGSPAPRHGRMPFATKYGMYGGYANALHIPGTAVPVAWNDDNLPIGLQVLGPRFGDLQTLAIAEVLEEAFGGWRRAESPALTKGTLA